MCVSIYIYICVYMQKEPTTGMVQFHTRSFGCLGLSATSLTAWSKEVDQHSESTVATDTTYIL